MFYMCLTRLINAIFHTQDLLITPNQEEFLAARNLLIKLMEIRKIGGKRVRELSNDALIFTCAWNSRSVILTDNIDDFHMFNQMMTEEDSKKLLPIFSIDDLGRALHEDVSFPENIIFRQPA